MSCIYKYKGKDYTKDEFYSLVRTTMVQPRTVQIDKNSNQFQKLTSEEKDNIGKLIRNLNQGRFNKVLNLYVNPDFVNEQHNKLPSSQRNDVEVDLSKDQKFFNEKKQITQQFTSLQKPKNVLQEEWDFLTEEEREKLNNCK